MEGGSRLELTIAVPGMSSSSGSEGASGGLIVRDLDINQLPEPGEEDFPMSTVDDDEDGLGGAIPRPKKLRLTKEQSRLLEESFRLNQTLNPKQKEELASKLNLRPRQVEVWFQNRRARTKLKQTEMECEYLKRCFGSLTEENRRLQREVEELRALRVAPPTVISPHTSQPMPASSLTMCPRCERVTASNHHHHAPPPGTSSAAVPPHDLRIFMPQPDAGLPFPRAGAFRPRQPAC